MIPIYLPVVPHDEKFLSIIHQNIRLLLLCIFEENFMEFEQSYQMKRETILSDTGTTRAFARWINEELYKYDYTRPDELCESYLAAYCAIRSKEALDLEDYPLMIDLLYRVIARAQKYYMTCPEIKSDDPACAAKLVSDGASAHVVGRRITPKENRAYVRKTYKKFRRKHRDATIPAADFLMIVETVDCLDAMLRVCPIDFNHDEWYEGRPFFLPELYEVHPFFLPERWWDPACDVCLWGTVVSLRPEDEV